MGPRVTGAETAIGPGVTVTGNVTAAGPVVLTAHPLQRIGAFALAEIGEAAGPETMTSGQFGAAAAEMADDVAATADVEDAKSAGGFWLGVSYLMWPNSAMNPTARKKLPTAELRDRIRAWRTYPETRLGVPCALCGRVACGFFGKVDVPLGASTEHRNTTAPGHGGLALCTGCLASFHALPYGCQIGGGRASALHSWDDAFVRRTVSVQVHRTRQRVAVASGAKGPGPFAREVAALRRLRGYDEGLRAGVELYVFSNSNREQVLEVHALEQPLAEWLRATMRDAQAREGFRYLVRAHWTEKIPGSALLARSAFRDPERIVRRAARFLAVLASESGVPAGETTALAGLCLSFATEVLQVQQRDVDQITELAGRIAGLLCARPERGTLKTYENAHRDSRQLQSYLKREAVAWALQPGRSGPFVTSEQWRLLFDPDSRGWFCQDLLLMSVLQSLAAHGWLDGTDDPSARAARDDDAIHREESEEEEDQ
jgi:hypothetical protein